LIATGLGFAAQLATAAEQEHSVQAESHTSLEQLDNARRLLDAKDYPAAGKALDEILAGDAFKTLEPDQQYAAFVFAAYAALGGDDLLAAHEYSVAATSFPMATGDIWALRAGLAIDVQNWGDAADSLKAVANQWPDQLAAFDARTIYRLNSSLDQDPHLEQPRLELIAALFDANYTLEYGFQPAYLWQDLAAALIDKKRSELIQPIVKRIDDPHVLARMRIDRRFDEVVKANPAAFDIAVAARSRCVQIRKVMEKHPRDLQPVIEFMYAQFAIGAFKENVKFADELLESIQQAPKEQPPFEDSADKLNWIYDIKAHSLRALGRWEKSLQVQKQANALRDVSDDQVSQAINLGVFYNEHGEPAKALAALEVIDWGRSLSGYGRMQLEHVRLRAYLQLGQRDAADPVLAYLREHQKDAPNTWLTALLDWGDEAGAAALLIARLRNPKDRVEALWSVQSFLPLPVMPAEKQSDSRRDAMLNREDVVAAINEVGRRETLPIYDIN